MHTAECRKRQLGAHLPEALTKRFILGSGLFHHMCSRTESVCNIRTVHESDASLGDDTAIKVDKVGKSGFLLQGVRRRKQEGICLKLTHVLYPQNMGLRLLSTSAFHELSIRATFKMGEYIPVDRSDGIYNMFGRSSSVGMVCSNCKY